MAGDLTGRRIVVPESRELDLFAAMLEREGAAALRCPLVTIRDVEDAEPVEAWLRRLAEERFDDLILFTGEGVSRLMDVADRIGLAEPARAGMARARKIVRGPKPTRALRRLGLAPDLSAEPATTEGVIALLADEDLTDRRVGLQGYPGQGGELVAVLTGRGARVDRVEPYRYASDREDAAVADAIRAMARGEVDLIAFTSRPQIKRLVEVATARHLTAELATAMTRTLIAAVGPVTAEAVQGQGWTVAIVPEESFHLKPFVATMRRLFAAENGRRDVGRIADPE